MVVYITYYRTLSGFVDTTFVTDVYSCKIVGWATRSSMKTEALPLQALEQAIALRKEGLAGLVHHPPMAANTHLSCIARNLVITR